MAGLLSVIVCQINVKRGAIIKAENDPPAGTHDDGPNATKVADERMKAETWTVHVFHIFRLFQEAGIFSIFSTCSALTPLRSPSSNRHLGRCGDS
jgi:hypothetical protein